MAKLVISFTAGSLFDLSAAEALYQSEGIDAYRQEMDRLGNEVDHLEPGPALGFYLTLQRLNRAVPNEIMDLRFALISKNSSNTHVAGIILKSISHYLHTMDDAPFDHIAFVNGASQIPPHQALKTDLAITTSLTTAKELLQARVPAIVVSPESNNQALYTANRKLVWVSDFDGVIGHEESEATFQELLAAYDDKEEAVKVFHDMENQRPWEPHRLGPLGAVTRVISQAGSYLEQQQQQNPGIEPEIELELVLLTARAGNVARRLFSTLEHHDIQPQQCYMMAGESKNSVLTSLLSQYQEHQVLFVDDGAVHINRSRDVSGSLLPALAVNELS